MLLENKEGKVSKGFNQANDSINLLLNQVYRYTAYSVDFRNVRQIAIEKIKTTVVTFDSTIKHSIAVNLNDKIKNF